VNKYRLSLVQANIVNKQMLTFT